MFHDVKNDHVFQVLVKSINSLKIGTLRMFCSLWSLKNKQALKFYTQVKKNFMRKSIFIYIHDVTSELTWPNYYRNQGQYLCFLSRIWQCDQKPHKMNIQLRVRFYRSLCRFWGQIAPRNTQNCNEAPLFLEMFFIKFLISLLLASKASSESSPSTVGEKDIWVTKNWS